MKNVGYIVLLVITLGSCKSSKSTYTNNSRERSIERGVASWYGPGFQGKKTANGETFNTNHLTAAHRTLPFNTQLRVKNLGNGKSVVVRINDRGPYAKDRIIDLSKEAATKLDMIQAGTARVELFLLGSSNEHLSVENLKQPTYAVQIASLSDERQAEKKANSFRDGWVKRVLVNRKTVYRVLIGKFNDTKQADRRNAELKTRGINGFVKQVEN